MFIRKLVSVSALAILCMTVSGCREEGVVAHPNLNVDPKHALVLQAELRRVPNGKSLNGVNQYMVARYESSQLACSQIRHFSGGSVVTPLYEVPLRRNEDGEFIAWVDLIKPDQCKWRLSMIRYGLTSEDGSVIAEAAFSREKLESAPLIFYCDWSGPLDGSCRMYRPIAENDWSLDDTTIIINVKED